MAGDGLVMTDKYFYTLAPSLDNTRVNKWMNNMHSLIDEGIS